MNLKITSTITLLLTICAFNQSAHGQWPQAKIIRPGTVYQSPGYMPGYYPPQPVYPMGPGVVGPGMVTPMNMGGTYYWHSPSGYYYPWYRQVPTYYGAAPTVIYMQEGSNAPAQPPLNTMFSDMKKYLSESKEKKNLSDADYKHLSLRLSDITRLYQDAISEQGGAIDSSTEADLRSKLNDLSLEISQRVKS